MQVESARRVIVLILALHLRGYVTATTGFEYTITAHPFPSASIIHLPYTEDRYPLLSSHPDSSDFRVNLVLEDTWNTIKSTRWKYTLSPSQFETPRSRMILTCRLPTSLQRHR